MEYRNRGINGSGRLHLDVTDSTNTECKHRAAQGAADGLVITATEQTGGRGRAGRTFQSPRGCGLYLSALLRPQLPPEQVVDFTAWVAVAACDGIEAACGLRPRIKWTNDLVLNGKKLAGILTELGLAQGGKLDWLITGIGVNANHRREDFEGEVQDIATSLALELGRPVDIEDLTAHIIGAIDSMYAGFPGNRQEYLDKYRADCMTPGNRVQLITPVSREEAYAVAIDDEFRLVVELPDGTRRHLSTGEVSVRGMYGYV